MLKEKIKMLVQKQSLWMYLVIIVLLISAFCFVPRDGSKVDVVNSDASYHTLSMIKNFQDYPASEHLFVPTVTMKNGAPTAWGPCMQGNDGKFYYCSFMPLDVAIPYWFFCITGLDLSIAHLHILSLILAFISIVLLEKIVYSIFDERNYNRAVVGVAIALVYMFSYEGIQCATNVFWGEILFQPVMLWVIYWLLNAESKRAYLFASIGVVLGCMLDWSAYCFAAIVAIILLVKGIKNKSKREIKGFFGVSIATVLAGIITILHYSLKVGINGYLDYCLQRFGMRRVGTEYYDTSTADLLKGYVDSFGPWLIVLLISVIVLIIYQIRNEKIQKLNLALVVLIFTCIENILMMEHAIEYRYDRNKLAPIIVLCVISCIIIVWEKVLCRKTILTVITVLAVFCFAGYVKGINGYVVSGRDYSDNDVLAKYFKEQLYDDDKDILVGINPYCPVEGYGNILFDCNIVALNSLNNDPVAALKNQAIESGCNRYIYILTDYMFAEKYHILGLIEGNVNDSEMTYYYVAGKNKVKSYSLDDGNLRAMPTSDRDFLSGVCSDYTIVRFNKNDYLAEALQPGVMLKSPSGNEFEIEGVTVWDDCIDVKFVGYVNRWYMKDFEFPNKIVIE